MKPAVLKHAVLKQEWFETFFQGPAVEFWTKIIPSSVTLAEAAFLETALDLEPSARVLNVPCGNGRHAIELARRGHRVTGVDLSREFLDLAARAAADANLTVDWLLADMRGVTFNSVFDAAYCFGNSFGYLDRADASSFLTAIARALQPNGRLAIDTSMAAESILASPAIRRWHRTGDIITLSEPRYVPEAGRLDIDYTFVHRGLIETRPSSSYVFTTSELIRMLNESGFGDIKLHGGIAGEPYHLGSPRLILTARVSPPASAPPHDAM